MFAQQADYQLNHINLSKLLNIRVAKFLRCNSVLVRLGEGKQYDQGITSTKDS